MPYNLSIPGQVSEHQLKAIEAVAALVPKNGRVVEVGSLFGCSSWAWAKSVDPSVTVYCIDPWEKNEGVRAMEARLGITYGIEQFKLHTADCPNIRPLQGYSPMQFQDWSEPVDLYYEDAVHTNPILAQNLAFWSAKLKPSGILCGDDYRARFPDVMGGAQELARRFGRELIRVDFFWCLLPEDKLLPGASAIATRLRELGAEHDALKRKRGPVFQIGPRQPLSSVALGTSPVVSCRLSNETLDAWPEAPAGPVVASVRITTQVELGAIIGEVRLPLPVSQLAPDIPIDFDVVLPTAILPEGSYRLIFDLVAPGGSWAISAATKRAAAVALSIVPPDSINADVPAGAASLPAWGARMPLFDVKTAIRDFTSVVFADSHGAFDRHLGAGALYYALGHVVRSQVSVCIGSGGGFVPSLMRRAQLDAGIDPSITYLIDANLPDLAFGSPLQSGGWLTSENEFLEREKDIVVLPMLSVDAAQLLARNGIRIDHLHIDGDHSVKGVLADLEAFLPLVSPNGVISMHDLRMPGVNEALAALLAAQPTLQLLSFRDIGNGTGVLRRTLDASVPRRQQTVADLADPGRKLAIEPASRTAAIEQSRPRTAFERWSYLKTPTYRLRYRLVGDWIDQDETAVVEVGGFPNSIVHELSKARAAHLIEPYTTPPFESDVLAAAAARHIPAYIHKSAVGRTALDIEALKPFNLVALGLDLSSACKTEQDFEQALAELLALMTAATRIALEVPKFRLSQLLFGHLLRIAQPKVVQDVTLDLSQDPVGESYHVKDARAVRRIVLIEGTRYIDAHGSDTRALVTLAARELADALVKDTRPVESIYTLGERIEFKLGGNAEIYKRDGWVGAEKYHTWMNGARSSIRLALTNAVALTDDQELELVLDVKPFVVAGKLDAQRLNIRVNDVEVLSSVLRDSTVLHARFSVDVARARLPIRVDFFHPDAARPCELLEGSADSKLLSIAVRSLCLTAAPKSKACV